jgi:hypothetical protein
VRQGKRKCAADDIEARPTRKLLVHDMEFEALVKVTVYVAKVLDDLVICVNSSTSASIGSFRSFPLDPLYGCAISRHGII